MAEVDPDEARRAADEILSRPEYQEPEPGVVERAFGWLAEQLGRVFDALTGGGPGGVVGWVVVAVLLGLAAWLLRRVFVLPGMPGHRSSGRPVRYGTSQRRSAQAWRDEAERRRAAGDHRNALRCRYQALVVELTDAGVLDATPGRTTGEHRARLHEALVDEHPVIDRVTGTFERTWYGGDDVSADDYAAFVADAERLAPLPATAGAGR